jgi:inorganic triphosphatase YgiF
MNLEQEIKLQIIGNDVIDLTKLDWLKKYCQFKPKKQRLVSTYFDTLELHLINQGVGLRLRNENGRWLQTVKCTGQVKNGLHQREEWEHVLTSKQFDLIQLKQTPLEEMIDDPTIWPRLKPVFTTDFERQTLQLSLPDKTEVELAYDRGEVRTETFSEPINEIELELKQGSVKSLKLLAEQCVKQLSVEYHDESKAHRGYRLVQQAQ